LRHELKKLRRGRRGVGLVELLVALAISAALLTAVAVAVDTSFKAYAVNQSQAQLLQRARLALHRMVAYVRTTTQHRPDDDAVLDSFEQGLVCNASSIRMLLTDTTGVIFRQSNNQLQMVNFHIEGNVLVEDSTATLLNGVGANDFRIVFEPMRSAAQIRSGNPAYDQLKRASILLTVRPSTNTSTTGEEANSAPVTVSTSVMPRRNFW